MKYCSECGTKLIEKECGIDGLVPYCPTCKQFRFPMFNSAISTIIFNPTKDKILLIKQYGKNFNVLVAGYITKGENAKETLIREIKEEVNLNVVDYTYNDNEYYQPSNTLTNQTRLSCSFIFRKIFKKTALAVFLIQIFSICFNDFFIPIK